MDILNAIVALLNFVFVPGIAYDSQLALGALGVTLIYAILRFSNFAPGDTMTFATAMTMANRTIIVSAILATPPHSALAEGASQTFNCRVVTTCDAAGTCAPDPRTVVFRLDPIDVGPHGGGTYTISYDDVSAQMVMQSWIGPMIWAEGQDDLQTLLVSGQNTLLWQQMQGAEPRSAAIHFLDCESPQ